MQLRLQHLRLSYSGRGTIKILAYEKFKIVRHIFNIIILEINQQTFNDAEASFCPLSEENTWRKNSL